MFHYIPEHGEENWHYTTHAKSIFEEIPGLKTEIRWNTASKVGYILIETETTESTKK